MHLRPGAKKGVEGSALKSKRKKAQPAYQGVEYLEKFVTAVEKGDAAKSQGTPNFYSQEK